MTVSSPSSATKKTLKIVLGVALVVHLLSAIGVYVLRPESISTTPDPLDYRLAALQLLEYGHFSFVPPEYEAPQLLRTPAYPAVVAGTYLMDGKTGLGIVLLQSVMLVAMGWMLFWLLLAFRVPEKITLVLTTAYLFEPLQWLYTLHTMTETTASFLVLALIAGALVGKGISTILRAGLFGLGLGLAILVKPTVVMWAPFLVLLVLFSSQSWRARLVRFAVVALVCLITLTPWLLRNYGLTGSLVISSISPYALIEFATTPDTAPARFWEIIAEPQYNNRTHQVWHAYTANAYPMLVASSSEIRATLDYGSAIYKQLMCAPRVWFGFTNPVNEQSYGHQYSLLAGFVLGENETRDNIINFIDTLLWSLALPMVILGALLLLRNKSTRYQFAPLAVLLLATIFINYCHAWARVLLPVYPVIFVALGAGLTYLFKARWPKNIP